MISVFIVEDNKDTLLLLEGIVKQESDMLHIGSALTGRSALILIEDAAPDVVLMDVHMMDMNGIECVKYLKPRCPKTEFVMCTAFDQDELVYHSLRVGASSYLMKHSSVDFIVSTIREVHAGKSPMSSDIARKVVQQIRQTQQVVEESGFGITSRETQVLELLSKGRSYKEISGELFISIKTLKSHVYRIYKKLQVDNSREAVNKFYRR